MSGTSCLTTCRPIGRASSQSLLDYGEHTAGGIMTTTIAVATSDEVIDQVRARLATMLGHRGEIDAVAVLDGNGCLIGDVALFDLLLAEPSTPIGDLVDEAGPVTVSPRADVSEVAAQLVEARRSSVLVVEDERPIGRILADDVVDALLPDRGRLHFPRFLQ